MTSSRAPLRIAGEQEYPVPPLELPDPERLPSLEALAQSDAVRLFIERAMAVKPEFRITAENAAAVAEICSRLDGLPLALELAAARVKLLTPQAMLPRLRKGLDLLASSSPDRTDRQRTLRGAIGWSYDLLDDGMKRLFARAGVFVGGATLEQLETVCGPAPDVGREVLDGLSELVDQSLLRQSEAEGEPRFRMLVTIREYALERLEASGEAREIRQRHADAYCDLAHAAAPQLQGPDRKQWLDRLEREHGNLRAALEFLIASGAADEASRLVFALWRFWQSRGHLREGRMWADRALALPGPSHDARLRALEAAGGLLYWMGDLLAARGYYRQMYDLAADDRDERGQAAYNIAFTFIVDAADIPTGRAFLEESLAVFRAKDDRAGIGRAAWALASTYIMGLDHSREEFLRGRSFAEEALAQHRPLENRFDVAWDLHSVGLSSLKLGDYERARLAWSEALDIFSAADDSSGIVLMLSHFAELAKAAGDLERHDTLVGAWTALEQRTGVGLASVWVTSEKRAAASDIPPERRVALERGLAMKTDEALAFARQLPATKTA
jgi:predicted ATPase